jgi:hypothetical protein
MDAADCAYLSTVSDMAPASSHIEQLSASFPILPIRSLALTSSRRPPNTCCRMNFVSISSSVEARVAGCRFSIFASRAIEEIDRIDETEDSECVD